VRLETKFNQSYPILNHRYTQLIPKNPDLPKKRAETQKGLENPRFSTTGLIILKMPKR